MFIGLQCQMGTSDQSTRTNEKIVFKADRFSLIPAKFYQPESADLLLSLSSIVQGQTKAVQVPFLKSKLLYDHPGDETFDFVQPASLLTYGQLISGLMGDSFLHFHLDISFLYVFCYAENRLQLANSFRFNNREDILYSILSTASLCGIDPRKDAFIASGFLRLNTELFSLLTKYIERLIPLNRFEGIQFSQAFADIPKHYFADVFTLPLCE